MQLPRHSTVADAHFVARCGLGVAARESRPRADGRRNRSRRGRSRRRRPSPPTDRRAQWRLPLEGKCRRPSTRAPCPGHPPGGRISLLDGRSPGLRVLALAAFPDLSSGFRLGLVAYSCGDSRGVGSKTRTAFPLSSFRCGKETVEFGFRLGRRASQRAATTPGIESSAPGCGRRTVDQNVADNLPYRRLP